MKRYSIVEVVAGVIAAGMFGTMALSALWAVLYVGGVFILGAFQ